MKYQVVILSEAVEDLSRLVDHLRSESPVTVVKLQKELLAVEKQLTQFPFAYQATQDATFRRVFLHSSRYTLYFRVQDRTVEVVAVLPQRIDPKLSQERINVLTETTPE